MGQGGPTWRRRRRAADPLAARALPRHRSPARAPLLARTGGALARSSAAFFSCFALRGVGAILAACRRCAGAVESAQREAGAEQTGQVGPLQRGRPPTTCTRQARHALPRETQPASVGQLITCLLFIGMQAAVAGSGAVVGWRRAAQMGAAQRQRAGARGRRRQKRGWRGSGIQYVSSSQGGATKGRPRWVQGRGSTCWPAQHREGRAAEENGGRAGAGAGRRPRDGPIT